MKRLLGPDKKVTNVILVSGSTGNVGGELVRLLAAGGHPVRGLVRSLGRSELPLGVDSAAGDLNRPETLAAPLAGVRGLFLLSGYKDMPGILGEARRAGVERVVLLSGRSATLDPSNDAITHYIVGSENAVHESGIAWTMLRPCGFMSNALQWAAQIRSEGVVHAAFAGVRTASIDPFDIAAVAARALRGPGHGGRVYNLSGPESLLAADRVRILAEVLDRPIRFQAQNDAEAWAEMSQSMPAEYVRAFFSFFSEGKLDESAVFPTVQEVTGQPPHTFEQWATAHAAAFR